MCVSTKQKKRKHQRKIHHERRCALVVDNKAHGAMKMATFSTPGIASVIMQKLQDENGLVDKSITGLFLLVNCPRFREELQPFVDSYVHQVNTIQTIRERLHTISTMRSLTTHAFDAKISRVVSLYEYLCSSNFRFMGKSFWRVVQERIRRTCRIIESKHESHASLIRFARFATTLQTEFEWANLR